MYRTSVLKKGDPKGAEPVEYGIAVHLGLHQAFLDGDIGFCRGGVR